MMWPMRDTWGRVAHTELFFVRVESVSRNSDGRLFIVCHDGRTIDDCDVLLWAIGREPRSHDLELDSAGVAAGAIIESIERGYELEDGTILRPAKVVVARNA